MAVKRSDVAKELSELQRIGALSCKTNAVARTMNGEFDEVIHNRDLRSSRSHRSDSQSVTDAADDITLLVSEWIM